MPSAPSIDPVLPNEAQGGRCIRCGYALRGLPEPRCPECGLGFDPDHPAPADIPWLARREIGNANAYVRTIHRVLLCPRQFAEQVRRAGDVNRLETDAFWRVTIAVATASVVAMAALPMLIFMVRQGFSDLFVFPVVVALLPAPAALFFWMATWRVEVWPTGLELAEEIRFGRMQKFACAGLGLAPIVPLVTWAWVAMVELGLIPIARDASLAIGSACAIVLAAWLGGEFTFHLLGGRLRASQAAWFIVARLMVIAAAGVAGFFTLMFMGSLASMLIDI